MKTELEEAAKKYANKKGDIPTTKLEDAIFKQGFIDGAKWQQKQEQSNGNSWFDEYQEVENYIIKRIGNKFLEATPDKYKTASEATIALLENNWKKENMYSEEEVLKIIDLLFHKYASSFRVDAKEDFLLSKKK